MWAAARQATLPDFGLFAPTPLQTKPPTYLHLNNPPTTEPTLIVNPPLETPPKPHTSTRPMPGKQSLLGEHLDNVCPVCLRHESNIAEHLLVDHAEAVNARMAEIRAARTPAPDPEPEPDEQPIAEPEPRAFKEAPTEQVGQRMDGYNDPRECNGCETIMSKSYAKIFATEQGDLWCPNCKSRSERYSNDGTETHGTDPASMRGSKNPNSQANKRRKTKQSVDE